MNNILLDEKNTFFAPKAPWKRCALFKATIQPSVESLPTIKKHLSNHSLAIVLYGDTLYYVNAKTQHVKSLALSATATAEQLQKYQELYAALNGQAENELVVSENEALPQLISKLTANQFWMDSVENYAHRERLDLARSPQTLSNYEFNLRISSEEEAQFLADFKILEALQEDEDKKEIFWFYCLYCCEMLIAFYTQYQKQEKLDEYIAYRQKIKAVLSGTPLEKQAAKRFTAQLRDDFSSLIKGQAESFYRLSALRDNVAYTNLLRIYWVFCRVTLSAGFQSARAGGLFESFEKLLNQPIFDRELIHAMETITPGVNVCSVAFFAIKFIINAAHLLRHTFFPQGEEKNSNWTDRLSNEWSKRYDSFFNDVAWGAVNALTNFPELVNLSAPVANWIIVGFLLYDLALTLVTRHVKEKEYLRKLSLNQTEQDYIAKMQKSNSAEIAEKDRQWESLQQELSHLPEGDDSEVEKQRIRECLRLLALEIQEKTQLGKHYDLRMALVNQQRREIEYNWQVDQSKILFNAAAALLFAIGYSAALIFASPIVVTVSYFVCVVSVAMYLSGGAYGAKEQKAFALTEASLQLETARRVQPAGLDANALQNYLQPYHDRENKAQREYEKVKSDFYYKLTRNIVIPTLKLATLAVCWQAALVLVVLYTSYEIYKYYKNHQEQQAELAQEPALAPATA